MLQVLVIVFSTAFGIGVNYLHISLDIIYALFPIS